MKPTIAATIATFLILFLAPITLAQTDSSPSADIDEAVINDNIKERIKKVVSEGQTEVIVKKKKALVGSLQSVANETLTIKTKSDIKLASTSADTSYVRNPGNKVVDDTDLTIGDYVVAMGFLNGSEVLQVKRIILYAEEPEPVTKVSSFGVITALDVDTDEFTIQGQDLTVALYIYKNTVIKQGEDDFEFADLWIGQKVLVIHQVDKDGDNLALEINALPLEATGSAELSETATDSAELEAETTPAELGN